MHFIFGGLFFVIVLFVLNAVNADECVLDEVEPDCQAYCYSSVKPFLSYIPSMQKRLEACEMTNNKLPYDSERLEKIDKQLAEHLELMKSMQNQIVSCPNLQKVESKLQSMANQFKQEVEKAEFCMAKARSTEETLKEQRNLKDECQNELKSTKSLQSQLVDRSSLENLQYQLQQEEEKVKTCRASLRETDQTLGKQKRLKEECQNGKNQLSQELESTKSLQSQLVDRSSLENVESKLKNMEKQLKQEEGNVESCRASIKATEGSLAQQQSLTQQCQNERRKFRKIGQKYYHIENSEGNTWFGALQRCAEWGGHLVSFQNEHEWNSVRAALKIYGSYWIDINDLNREGTFVSATSGNSPSFVRWYRGEPNNGFAGTEHCVELGYNQQFHMNDGRCHLRNNFICESNNERVFNYNA